MKKLYQRRRIFVDRKVQGALAVRVAVYWLCSLLSIALLMGCWTAIRQGPITAEQLLETIARQFGPVFAASLLLLPIIMIDSVRQTNKFAGPMFRIRRAMKQLADGELVQPIQFRKGDFWCDFAADFNRVAARQKQEGNAKVAAKTLDESNEQTSRDTQQSVRHMVR